MATTGTKATTTTKATATNTDKPKRARKRVKAGQGLKDTPATAPSKATKKKAATKKATPTKTKVTAKKKATIKSSTPAKKSPKGCLEAAVVVLTKAKKPMGCKALMDAILEQKLWSTQGATPHQTLSSAIQREIKVKKKESRFVKTGRGLYTVKEKTSS